MQIEIEYGTQVRTASGLSRERVELPSACSLAVALLQLLKTHPKLAPWIDVTGQPRPGLLVFVNDQSISDIHLTQLQADDHIALLTLVSGG